MTIRSLHQEDQWRSNFSGSLVFYVLRRHTNKMAGKGFNVFNECASRCVHMSPQGEDCISSSGGSSKMHTSGRTVHRDCQLKQMKVAV